MSLQNAFHPGSRSGSRRTTVWRIVRNLIRSNNLNTVCSSAACPNQTECWNAGTATFMILGNICTRNCRFCGVPKGSPQGLDLDEPNRVAQAVASLQLKYVVITSVTRDDLDDGGSSLFAETIRAIRTKTVACRVEVLIPDFRGSENLPQDRARCITRGAESQYRDSAGIVSDRTTAG